MKSPLLATAAALLCSLTLAGAETVISSTTSDGTISLFSPDSIVVSSGTASPVTYNSSKTTTYVDEAGAPVSMEVIKSGAPVTVHYIKEGDRMIANRVIVRRTTTTTTAPAPVIEKTTTTTTTTK